MPAKNQSVKKNTSLIMAISISAPANFILTATVESNTINKTATKSSITKTPITIPANFFDFRLSSSKARKMIVVDEMAMIPPKNKLSILFQPNN